MTQTEINRAVTVNMTVNVGTRLRTALVISVPTTGSSTESGKKVEALRSGGVMEDAAVTSPFLMVCQQSVTRTLRYRVAMVGLVILGLVLVLAALTTKL